MLSGLSFWGDLFDHPLFEAQWHVYCNLINYIAIIYSYFVLLLKGFIDEADAADKFESEKNRGIDRTLEAVTTSQMTRKTGIKRGLLPKDFVYK